MEKARGKCNEFGGYLAVINDANENEALFNYMVGMGYDQAFFGLSLTEDGQWEYPYNNRDISDFRDWGINSHGVREPNNPYTEHHAMLDVHMLEGHGHWNDSEFASVTYTPDGIEYNDKAAFICEWDY